MRRRDFLKAAGAFAACRVGARPAAALDLPLTFMLHAVRARAAVDLPGTLRAAAAMGYTEVELVSFPGFSGASARDGFAPLASMPPAAVRDAVRAAGLTASSAHFKWAEFQEGRLGDSLAWAAGVGVRYMTITELPAADSLEAWQSHFASFSRIGARLKREGFQLALHTETSLFRPAGPSTVIDALMRDLPSDVCTVQLDLSTAQSAGVSSAAILDAYPGRFFSVHLRDAPTPPTLGQFLPAVALGHGALDIPAIIAAARRARVEKYIVEMNVRDGDPLEAMRLSADYIRSL